MCNSNVSVYHPLMYVPAPGVGANIDVDDASDGGPPGVAPVTEGPGDTGRGWANGSDISDVSIAFASRVRFDAEDPPGVELAPWPACDADLLVGVLGSGELSILMLV